MIKAIINLVKKIYARSVSADHVTDELTCDLVPVKSNGLWGFVDKNGQEVIECQYDYVGQFKPFKSGYAAPVEVKGQWGLIDTTGKEIVRCRYSSIVALYERVAPVYRDW